MAFEDITPKIEENVQKSGVREVVVAFTDGKLDFGPWELIFDGEFDGRKSKRVLVNVIRE